MMYIDAYLPRLEISADDEYTACDEALRFAVEERTVCLAKRKTSRLSTRSIILRAPFAGRVDTEVLQNDQSLEGDQQADVLLRPAPLEGEKFGSPAFRRDASPLSRNRAGGFSSQVSHHLPTDRRVALQEPVERRGAKSCRRIGYCWRVPAIMIPCPEALLKKTMRPWLKA